MAAMAMIFLLTLLQGGLAQARGQNLVEDWSWISQIISQAQYSCFSSDYIADFEQAFFLYSLNVPFILYISG